MATEPWEPSRDGLKLFFKLAPKARADRLAGLEETAGRRLRLKVAVTAPPEKGKANAALIALLAKRLGLAKSRLSIASGTAHREKTIRIEDDPLEIAERLRGTLEDLVTTSERKA